MRDPFGVRSGSVRDPFGPVSDQNVRSQKFIILEINNLCGRRRRSGGPLAAVPSPAAAATAAQIESILSTIYWIWAGPSMRPSRANLLFSDKKRDYNYYIFIFIFFNFERKNTLS